MMAAGAVACAGSFPASAPFVRFMGLTLLPFVTAPWGIKGFHLSSPLYAPPFLIPRSPVKIFSLRCYV